MIAINHDMLALILTVLIPVAVALVTKSAASDRIKGAVALVLAAVVTLINGARTDTGPAIISTEMAWGWAVTTAIQLAAYLGVYKPLASINTQPVVLPSKGLG